MKTAVAVLARAPSTGGKTRLVAGLTPARLVDLRRALLLDTLATIDRVADVEKFLFYTPDDAEDECAAVVPAGWTLCPQRGGDLGARMTRAVDELLVQRRFAAAAIVGSDVPLLTPAHIERARDGLIGGGDVVLGPADDGGYYLIAMTRPHPALFAAIAWGTDSVRAATMDRAALLGITVHSLEPAFDVDTIDDLHRVERELDAAPPHVAPHLRRWLASYRLT